MNMRQQMRTPKTSTIVRTTLLRCHLSVSRRLVSKVTRSRFIGTYLVKLPTRGLLARNDFRVARDLGVVERMLPSQVRAAIFTVGLPRPRCTEDTGSGC